MLKLPSQSIQISPNRQRRDFDDVKIQELLTSLKKPAGLMHAIVVRSMGKGGFQLVAGERRLRAIELLRFTGGILRHGGEEIGEDLIPVVTLGELDEESAEEAELDENIRRVDLTWQERAEATARLAALRGRQAASAGAPAPSVAAIAEEVRGSSQGSNQESTRREIIVARHIGQPEVKAAKSLDEAWKVLKKAEETKKNIELAATVGRSFTAKVHEAYHADSLLWMAAYAGELFDVILTDPPYGMGADQFGDSGGKAEGAHQYDDSYENWKKIMPTFARLSYAVTKPQSHLYTFCDFDRFHELKSLLEDVGWNCFRTPLIWVKPTGSRTPWVDYGPQRKYELCLYANKGRRPVTKIFPDVVAYNPDENLGHNAQKPVALFVDMLKRSVAPGNTVLDPFAGSGTLFPAANELKCKAVAVESDANSFGIMLKRLEALMAQGELPV